MVDRLEARELKQFANAITYGSGNMEKPEIWAADMDRRIVGAEAARPYRPKSVEELFGMMQSGPTGVHIRTEK